LFVEYYTVLPKLTYSLKRHRLRADGRHNQCNVLTEQVSNYDILRRLRGHCPRLMHRPQWRMGRWHSRFISEHTPECISG